LPVAGCRRAGRSASPSGRDPVTGFVFPPPATPSVPVAGETGRFPVRRIWCAGRNYADHAREMGHDPEAEPPFFFAKPADAVVDGGTTIAYPPGTADLHHEAELVVALGADGAEVAEDRALALVWGYGAGNDLTRRDLQAAAKAARRPWDMAKGFDRSAVVGALTRAVPGQAMKGTIRCHVNGLLRQEARLADMIWPVTALIAALSRLVTLQAGDLIFTGTPAGVGPLQPGDSCRVTIDGLTPVEIRIRQPD
jgi:fumarylpyruvate hydrolase